MSLTSLVPHISYHLRSCCVKHEYMKAYSGGQGLFYVRVTRIFDTDLGVNVETRIRERRDGRVLALEPPPSIQAVLKKLDCEKWDRQKGISHPVSYMSSWSRYTGLKRFALWRLTVTPTQRVIKTILHDHFSRRGGVWGILPDSPLINYHNLPPGVDPFFVAHPSLLPTPTQQLNVSISSLSAAVTPSSPWTEVECTHWCNTCKVPVVRNLVRMVVNENSAEKRRPFTVNFQRHTIGDAGILELASAMPQLGSIVSLSLVGNQIGDEGAEALAQTLHHLDRLTMLGLHDNNIGDIGALALGRAVVSHKSLKQVMLTRNKITERGARALSEILGDSVGRVLFGRSRRIPIKTLPVVARPRPAVDSQVLRDSLQTTTVWSKDQWNNWFGTCEATAVVDAVSESYRKRHFQVHLSASNLGDMEVMSLTSVLPQLSHRLHRSVKGHSGASLTHGHGYKSGLLELRLEDNLIGDHGAIALAETLPLLTDISVLRLHGNRIGVTGCVALGRAISRHRTLGQVWLSPTVDTDSGARAFVQSLGDSVGKVCLFGSSIDPLLINLLNDAHAKQATSSSSGTVEGLAGADLTTQPPDGEEGREVMMVEYGDTTHSPPLDPSLARAAFREGLYSRAPHATSSPRLDCRRAVTAFRQGLYGHSDSGAPSTDRRSSYSVSKRTRETAGLPATTSDPAAGLVAKRRPGAKVDIQPQPCTALIEVDPFDGGGDPFEEIDELKWAWHPSRGLVGVARFEEVDPPQEVDPFLGDGDPFREDDPFQEIEWCQYGGPWLRDPFEEVDDLLGEYMPYQSSVADRTMHRGVDFDEVDPFLGDSDPFAEVDPFLGNAGAGTELDPFADGYDAFEGEDRCVDESKHSGREGQKTPAESTVRPTESMAQERVRDAAVVPTHSLLGTPQRQYASPSATPVASVPSADATMRDTTTEGTDMQDLRDTCQSQQAEIDTLRSLVATMDTEAATLRTQLSTSTQEAVSLHAKVSSLHESHAKSRAEGYQRIMGMHKLLDIQKERTQKAQQRVKDLKEQCGTQKAEIVRLESELRPQIASLRSALVTGNQQVQSLLASGKILQESNTALHARVVDMERAQTAAQQETASLRSELAASRTRTDSLQRDVYSRNMRVVSLQIRLHDLATSHTAALQEKDQQYAAMEHVLEEQKAKAVRAKQRGIQALAEVERLRSLLAEVEGQNLIDTIPLDLDDDQSSESQSDDGAGGEGDGDVDMG
ncbi:hypothetical protein KIPB_000429 [Kipferlia bialata]|uniref:Uncharacterized protein n=1 Tax=Kipferlia bialata TaxID=797122 RepID=A0A9K3GEC7_9EUKA|nr:hypothetical protein KIPB_000429 [Kipferlia bialata]|eukprot:g429.t1